HKFGWTRHVGDIRILTDPNYREIGLGTALAKEIFFLAVHLKLQIVTAHMMEDQQGARRVFQRFGFEEEAILKNHVLDLDGQKHNMVIMSQSIPEIWEQIQDIIDESVKIKSGS
ncbi:GNAT family N-acetyltransferase, partial [bacterium]|nr:GNAT family N-acetyltransferase [bacterium]